MLDLILLVVGLATALYCYLTWHYDHWKSKGVYTPPGVVPGVGHMWDPFLFRKSAQFRQCEIYNETKGHPAVGIYQFRKPALLLRDLNLIQTVLISDFSSFHDNVMEADETLDKYISKNPFILNGQRWTNLRKQLAPAFSPARVKTMFPLIQRVCQEFNNYIEKRQNEDIEVLQVNRYFTSEVVAKCAFGVDGGVFTNPNSEFYSKGMKIWDDSLYSPFVMLMIMYFPILNKLIFRKSFCPKDTEMFFISLVKQAAEYRNKYPEKAPDNDYLQFLLNLQKKDPEFTIDDIVAQSLTFFTDGFETSAVTASFAIYELTMNPDIQEALRQEVRKLDSFTYENITTLPLLDRVLHETLRKYSLFVLSKKCTNPTTLEADGKSFPVYEGQEVIIPGYGVHYDAEIYPNPEKFDPDRFLPENVKNRHPVSFLGFGGGPRTCLGYRFAHCQVKTLISNIVANFRVVKSEKSADMKLDKTMILPHAVGGLWARFQKL